MKQDTDNRMAKVIRAAVSDPKVFGFLLQKDLVEVLDEALPYLSSSDVRGFIYRCFTKSESVKGLIMVDSVICYAADLIEREEHEKASEIVGAAIGTLSILSESLPSVKIKVDELIFHENPVIAAAVVENLGKNSDMDKFAKVCELLTHSDPRVAVSAAKYVESCTRDAAFRKRADTYVLEDAAEEFLRRALVPLEKTYSELRTSENDKGSVKKRLGVLVAMIYSEILDSTDWKRFKNEDVEERIYYTLEQHLHEDIGPETLHSLFKLTERPEHEYGTKQSALHAIGRMSKKKRFQEEIADWLKKYVHSKPPEALMVTANKILEAIEHGKPFSLVFELSMVTVEKTSMIPRAAGSPPKLDKQ